ncbi:hypothetical protein FIBSPDRAFT_215848 [Athelia psychrophila]|uniref:Uncharacterized protein n=1 Tax=Athelia psychrophila TaxID=1759441 RepID=A0A166SE38_9AGAM|nr:hypothetical protein FIBSPDRAFT_215848 [Fibularhizoctonia sp. CBS 109695]
MEQDREHLMRQASELTVSLESARKEYARIQNSLRPISALPNELLSAIFEMGCHTHYSGHPGSNSSGSLPFEIEISHVVRHWRAVALVCPHLWTNIMMDTRHYSQDLSLKYIQRSGAMPLNIRILSFGEDSFANLTSIIRLAFSLVGRWNRLHCEFDSFHDMEDFLDDLPSSAPTLRHLEIHYLTSDGEMDEHMEPAHPRDVFVNGAPLLRSIHFRGITLHSCCPPLNGVTSLQYQAPFEDLHPTWANHTISGLTSLTHLVLSIINFTEWQDDTTIALPSLNSLHLHSLWDYDKVLKALVVPRLQSLYLGHMDGAHMDRISLMLLRSNPAPRFPLLRSLTVQSLQQENIRVPAWNTFIAALPRITHFALLNRNIKNFIQVFSDTSRSAGAWDRWPSLEVLSLPNVHSVFEMRLVLAMKERRLSGYPVKVLKLPKSLVKGFKFMKALEGVSEVMQYDPAIDPGYEVEWLDRYDHEDEVVESEDEGDAYSDTVT